MKKKTATQRLDEMRGWVSQLTSREADALGDHLDDLVREIMKKRSGWPFRVIVNETYLTDLINNDPDVLQMEDAIQTRRVGVQELLSLEKLLNERYKERVLCIPDDFSFKNQESNPARLVMGINAVIDSSFRTDGLVFVHTYMPYRLTVQEYEDFIDNRTQDYYMGYVAYTRNGEVVTH